MPVYSVERLSSYGVGEGGIDDTLLTVAAFYGGFLGGWVILWSTLHDAMSILKPPIFCVRVTLFSMRGLLPANKERPGTICVRYMGIRNRHRVKNIVESILQVHHI